MFTRDSHFNDIKSKENTSWNQTLFSSKRNRCSTFEMISNDRSVNIRLTFQKKLKSKENSCKDSNGWIKMDKIY
ncbi:MAG: hypothetical protein ACI86C_001174 [Candidatus Latescibacterota bacterium]|jgi:hypothetical protein